MAKKIIKLPTVITEDVWFYEDNKEVLQDYIGMPYISYSSLTSWNDYQEDFIKQKFAGIKLGDKIYAEFGSFVGEAIENGEFGDNPRGFTGMENLNIKELRKPNSEYEKFVLIPFSGFIFIGFIDRRTVEEDGIEVTDFKTGGKGKEDYYSSAKYRQTILYAHAEKTENVYTNVYFIRREGSHIKPPLEISKEQFIIPIEYNEQVAQEALNWVEETVLSISECYKTYLKVFG